MSDGDRDRKRVTTKKPITGVTPAESSDEQFERTIERAVSAAVWLDLDPAGFARAGLERFSRQCRPAAGLRDLGDPDPDRPGAIAPPAGRDFIRHLLSAHA